MELGSFSVSLAVKDIEKSKLFYENIGFAVFGGDQTQNWIIMKNGDHTIGLFQGMFENNILTFNPGWDNKCNELDSFADVRDIYNDFKSKGIKITNDSGPSSFSVIDPDGNSIMIDQHV